MGMPHAESVTGPRQSAVAGVLEHVYEQTLCQLSIYCLSAPDPLFIALLDLASISHRLPGTMLGFASRGC